MFYPNCSEIEISRDEPTCISIVSHTNLANEIVTKNLLKPSAPKKDLKEKILKEKEFTRRYYTQEVVEFVTIWNYWRDFYYQARSVKPKTKTQLTCIENILQYVEDNEMNLKIYLGTIHRGYLYRKHNPDFCTAWTYGADFYDKFYDEVVDDIMKSKYERESMNG